MERCAFSGRFECSDRPETASHALLMRTSARKTMNATDDRRGRAENAAIYGQPWQW
jgi:hypothetical protein